jgi:glucose-1-phosphate thymidylyltransferase
MLSGIQEVLIISTPNDLPILQRILGDGSDFGLRLAYTEQPKPEGLAQAFLIGEAFLAGAPATLILGDNLIFGQDLTRLLASANSRETGATIFGYRVKNPSAFGVVEFDEQQKVLSIEEKPTAPKSHYAVPGLYYYDAKVCEMAKQIKPSPRGELEITDLNALYLQQGELQMELFGRGTAWLDMGTHESLHRASVYVESIQSIQGFQIANLEEIAFRKGWITVNQLERTLGTLGKTGYTQYLQDILQDPGHKNLNICAA